MGRRKKVSRARLLLAAGFLGLWGGAILVRLVDLHVVKAAHYRERASRQHERQLEISPRRGAIRDRNGTDLAISIEVDSLYANPAEVEDARRTAGFLAPILGLPVETLEARLSGDGSFVWLKRKISAGQSADIRARDLPGLHFQQESKRFYPNLQLASHVLGFVNLDNEGVGGLEYEYDQVIGGTPGTLLVQLDARKVPFEGLQRSPTEGASLRTTLDTIIQHFVEEEIDRTIEETGAVGMSVIVMNPSTGAILAMANYPTYNPNQYTRSPETAWSNRAIKSVYEPGSTFKIATAAAVLEERLGTMDEIVDGQNGTIVVHGRRIRDHKPFGLLSLAEVLQYSSNVGIIKFGTRLGDVRFASYIERFGFGQRTGIDLMGEERGLVRPASEWSGLSSSVISLGQELSATPIQILNLAAAVGNGGTMYRPFVVGRIERPDGQVDQTRPDGRRVMSEGTAALLGAALASAVTDGTGQAAAIPGYTSAGKTGTAQKFDASLGRYSETKHVASFAGYAPAVRPSIAAVIVIDEPNGPYHGGEVAAPVFGRLAAQILRHLEVRPDAPFPSPGYTEDNDARPPTLPVPARERADPAPAPEWEVLRASFPRAGSGVLDPASMVEVPDYTGLPLREVYADTAGLGLELLSSGSGIAVAQRPSPGELVMPGARIDVRFSTEFNGREAPRP
jgi:cell division protein FtsI (penicillin-binding protein 3)